jgi:iron complex transport system permease protein
MTDLLQRAPSLVAGRPPLRCGQFSGVWRPRMVAVTLAGIGLTVLMAMVNISRGEFPIALGEVLAVLLGGGEASQQFIVLDLRLPRTLTAILVGAALGLSGAITQTVARNPLASPDILGVTAGASTAAVIVIVLGGSLPVVASISDLVGLPLAALLGGLLTAVIVYGLSWRRGIEGYRLVLVGVGVGAVAEALTSWMLVYADITDAARATVWLTGSLNARGWEHVVPVATALAVLVPIGLLLAFGLGALQLGDDTARSLGVRVDRARSALLLTAVGLAAIATASAGPIAFVALVVPQVCLRLVGFPRPPLLASTVYGALLLLISDVIARTALPVELPVGIITAILGAPYLIWLLVRGNRA